MKNNVLILLVFTLSFVVSCGDMNDIQKEFADREERVYLGKVDSLKVYPGLARAKLTWYINADPKIEQTIIYWNMREDSVVKDFTRTTPGIQKDSIIIEDLAEGSMFFEFRNVNSNGESSLFSSITVSAWGEDFVSTLKKRTITTRFYEQETARFNLNLSSTFKGDSVVYSEMLYDDMSGEEKIVKIPRETDVVNLYNFPDGGELKFRTVFFSPLGIDTLFTSDEIIKAPITKHDNGKQSSLTYNEGSNYFYRTPTLFEWNVDGDLIAYTIKEEAIVQTNIYPGVAPRTKYRALFDFDTDLFIGVSTTHNLTMNKLENGELVLIKTPAGSENLGTGFSMPLFLSYNGMFFSVSGGEIKRWLARADATWGSPNGTTTGTGYQVYSLLAVYNYKTLLAVDAGGDLWSIPISVGGTMSSSKNKIGRGWNKFKKIIPVGTKLLCLDGENVFWEFDFNVDDYFWVIE